MTINGAHAGRHVYADGNILPVAYKVFANRTKISKALSMIKGVGNLNFRALCHTATEDTWRHEHCFTLSTNEQDIERVLKAVGANENMAESLGKDFTELKTIMESGRVRP